MLSSQLAADGSASMWKPVQPSVGSELRETARAIHESVPTSSKVIAAANQRSLATS